MKIAVFLLVWVCIYVPILMVVIRNEREMFDEKKDAAKCRFCSSELTEIIDFGQVALAGGFLKPENFKAEKKYPLKLCYCVNCFSVQIEKPVPADMMFRDYFYFSSATASIRSHFREYAADVVERFNPRTAIEIGCNDGVLTGPLMEAGVQVTGVDPSNTIPDGPNMIRDYFTVAVAEKIGHVDLIVANNVMAHIADIKDVTRAVVRSLGDDGVFVMEVHYLGDMIEKLQYDWIYHEHIFYYSLLSLENHFSRFGLSVFDVKPAKTHGGSMRYYICRSGKRREEQSVKDLRDKEAKSGLDRLATFERFAERVKLHRKKLRKLVGSLNGKVAGYGASGRANTIIQWCGIKVDYIVDDAPAKHGFYTPGSHIPIVSGEALSRDRPDHVIAFAWGYAGEIQAKCGLPMIVPLPEIELIEGKIAA